MLEAGWREVLWGSVSTGKSKMSQVLGAIRLLDFTTLRAVFGWGHFETYELFFL
jgi:hypothetical protein